jgi:hypothetical protein
MPMYYNMLIGCYRERDRDGIFKLLRSLGIDSIQGINSASLCSLAGRYDKPNIPTRFLTHIECLKIPALVIW